MEKLEEIEKEIEYGYNSPRFHKDVRDFVQEHPDAAESVFMMVAPTFSHDGWLGMSEDRMISRTLEVCLEVNPESTSKIIESLEKQLPSDKTDGDSLFYISKSLGVVLVTHPESVTEVMNVLEKVCVSEDHEGESLNATFDTLASVVHIDKQQAGKVLELAAQMISSPDNEGLSMCSALWYTLPIISKANSTLTDKVAEEMIKISSADESLAYDAGKGLAQLAIANLKEADKVVGMFEKNISSSISKEIRDSILTGVRVVSEDYPENIQFLKMQQSLVLPGESWIAWTMPKRLSEQVDKHSPRERMVAEAIFKHMSVQGNVTPLEWRKNKHLQEQFFEELSSAEKMGVNKALRKYVMDTPRNRKDLVEALLDERGASWTRYTFRAVHTGLYAALDNNHAFEKMFAHKYPDLLKRVETAREQQKDEENVAEVEAKKSPKELRRESYLKQKEQTEAKRNAKLALRKESYEKQKAQTAEHTGKSTLTVEQRRKNYERQKELTAAHKAAMLKRNERQM